jgi:hypothetical protein
MVWSSCSVRGFVSTRSKQLKIEQIIQDLLGSGIFGFVQSDIRSNINVRVLYPSLY